MKAPFCKRLKWYSKERSPREYSLSKVKEFFLKTGIKKKKRWLKFQDILKRRKVEETLIIEHYSVEAVSRWVICWELRWGNRLYHLRKQKRFQSQLGNVRGVNKRLSQGSYWPKAQGMQQKRESQTGTIWGKWAINDLSKNNFRYSL